MEEKDKERRGRMSQEKSHRPPVGRRQSTQGLITGNFKGEAKGVKQKELRKGRTRQRDQPGPAPPVTR